MSREAQLRAFCEGQEIEHGMTVHLQLEEGHPFLLCCDRRVIEVPVWHRFTTDLDQVTCPRSVPVTRELLRAMRS